MTLTLNQLTSSTPKEGWRLPRHRILHVRYHQRHYHHHHHSFSLLASPPKLMVFRQSLSLPTNYKLSNVIITWSINFNLIFFGFFSSIQLQFLPFSLISSFPFLLSKICWKVYATMFNKVTTLTFTPVSFLLLAWAPGIFQYYLNLVRFKCF